MAFFVGNGFHTARLIRGSGGPMIGFPYSGGSFQAHDVGSVTFLFIDANHALMTYSVDGIVQSKNIQRFSF